MHAGYELVWMAAERTPNQFAIVDDRTERRLTYRELIVEVDMPVSYTHLTLPTIYSV